jgi:glycosyltransferase involved in cell wall biosynthesis
LEWADDVILVDSLSTDDTVAAAKAARSDVRVFQNRFVDFGDQRNWAIDHTQPKHDWVLFLDADERCTPECASAIRCTLDKPTNKVGFFMTCRNMFMGRWMKHCGLYPSWQLRLFKRGQVRYAKEGHGQREVTDGPLGFISTPYDHFGFSKGVEEWTARHEKYAAEEVGLLRQFAKEPLRWGDAVARDPVKRRRFFKRLLARAPGVRPHLRFAYMYFLRAGFLDGIPGFLYCRLYFGHEYRIAKKLRTP